MRNLISTLALALYASAAAADATLDRRQGTSALANVTCGRNTYSRSQIEDAVFEGCSLHAAGEQLGNSRYPHRFNNREGLTFATAGPYQEFPILSSGAVYSGRSPGADRVVFNPDYEGSCVYVGAMTHTGAPTRNGFVECDEVAGDESGGTTTTLSPSSSGTASGTASAPTGTETGTGSEEDPEDNAAAAAGLHGVLGVGVQMVVGGLVGGLLWL
ncbi:Ribonuclease/ribotoxin [Chaetomium fimeti]|uniref:ribonuclease T1 n=1 Tax=Chaetomium fimeti TaxID=1854472 RepID=A0AAE0H8V9_9PEZI|nr:Ribonuclease/ribotoxin [Chaetomium fimeti]